ncbi:PX domain-containing protein [Plectosphaerella plurivora]|uniref:PX domain-containing protein n=1 Tax=Plectosphaerella plurivora TaxID=936078 RepID=A0A9P8VMC0_9PEZI|nr:PX domain-containing protein [Plectosphaerella plurivora]
MDPIVDQPHSPGEPDLLLSMDSPIDNAPDHGTLEKPPTEAAPLPAPSTATTKQNGQPEDDMLTKTFRYLSTATPETLGSIGVGLAAATYVVLGKLGLILMGAFGGVVLFISYEARHPEISRIVRGERGTEVLTRLGLDRVPEPKTDDKEEEERAINSFDDFKPETREALGGFVDAVIRDYVKWWYSPILPRDSSFPLACRRVFNSFLISISNALYRKRPADAFLDFLTNSTSIFIVFLSELSAAYSDVPSDSNLTAADAVYNYLADNPDSSLANLLSQTQQAAKFRMVAEDLLRFLDKPTHACDPARIFLREILAGVVLETSLQTCSKPEWINGWIVYLLEAGEPDFSQAIDVGMQTGPDTTIASINNAFCDIDGNVGNISLAKPSRSSFERRKEPPMAHKKKLSKADEEMETAMEEMKRMNALLARNESRDSKDLPRASEDLDKTLRNSQRDSTETDPRKSSTSGNMSPRSASSADKPEDASGHAESLHSPITPRSTIDGASQRSSPKDEAGNTGRFTNFDQIVPPGKEEPEAPGEGPRRPKLTLHNATITLLDDSTVDTSRIRTKPTWDYLVQIEPASSHYAGWMIVRRYSDFETLHEILRRIAQVSGATAFTELHASLPNWKLHTRESLKSELERYIRDACWYQSLAESEGMKRFLEKDPGSGPGETKSALGWETVGKNMVDVLTLGSKGAMEGGKTIFGGVTGVFNTIGLGPRRQTASSLSEIQTQSPAPPSGMPPRMESFSSLNSISAPRKQRDSLDSQRSSIVSLQPGKMAPMERRPSYDMRGEQEPEGLKPRMDRWDRNSPGFGMGISREHSRASSLAALRSPLRSPSTLSLENFKPYTPTEDAHPASDSPTTGDGSIKSPDHILSRENSSTNILSPLGPPTKRSSFTGPSLTSPAKKPVRQYAQLSEPETRVAVELVFAVINEMYTLSSAWNIRRTLLTAAKSFLLRPGNPSLISIQKMMQESVIEGNASDAGMAYHLRKLRENTMPTDEERAAWPAEMTADEKEKLRIKARKMLIERGVPAALTGVMGQAATTDALGRIFDCLQIEDVSRGLMFGLILQGVRVLTH